MLAVIRKFFPASAVRFQTFTVAILAIMFAAVSNAAERKILLRNETIDTSGPKRQTMRTAATQPTSGLYLVQLKEELPADWREQLTTLNVEIARPVPHDAFVVELKEANLGALEALPFVHWVGPYLPEHKSHVKLQALAKEAGDRRVRVS